MKAVLGLTAALTVAGSLAVVAQNAPVNSLTGLSAPQEFRIAQRRLSRGDIRAIARRAGYNRVEVTKVTPQYRFEGCRRGNRDRIFINRRGRSSAGIHLVHVPVAETQDQSFVVGDAGSAPGTFAPLSAGQATTASKSRRRRHSTEPRPVVEETVTGSS